MFNPFAKWSASRREAQRGLFSYWDGRRQRRIDPLVASIALEQHPKFNLKTHAALIDAGDQESIDLALDATRQAFGIAPWNDELNVGLTVGETLAILKAFLGYLGALKKNISNSPISSAPTASPPAESAMSNTSV